MLALARFLSMMALMGKLNDLEGNNGVLSFLCISEVKIVAPPYLKVPTHDSVMVVGVPSKRNIPLLAPPTFSKLLQTPHQMSHSISNRSTAFGPSPRIDLCSALVLLYSPASSHPGLATGICLEALN